MFIKLQESRGGREMLEFRRSLPAYKEKDAVLSAISQNQVCHNVFYITSSDDILILMKRCLLLQVG